MRRFQPFKTLFCRNFLLSNMQICYPRRKYTAKTIFGFLKRQYFVLFLPYIFTQDYEFACLIKANFYKIHFKIVILDFRKPFKNLKILTVCVKLIQLLPIASRKQGWIVFIKKNDRFVMNTTTKKRETKRRFQKRLFKKNRFLKTVVF